MGTKSYRSQLRVIDTQILLHIYMNYHSGDCMYECSAIRREVQTQHMFNSLIFKHLLNFQLLQETFRELSV